MIEKYFAVSKSNYRVFTSANTDVVMDTKNGYSDRRGYPISYYRRHKGNIKLLLVWTLCDSWNTRYDIQQKKSIMLYFTNCDSLKSFSQNIILYTVEGKWFHIHQCFKSEFTEIHIYLTSRFFFHLSSQMWAFYIISVHLHIVW